MPSTPDVFDLDYKSLFGDLLRLRDCVTLTEAAEMFDRLRDLKIGHDHLRDGCAERAHLMCLDIAAIGIKPEKAWCFESCGETLRVKMPSGQTARWWFHVAPVVAVDTGAERIQAVFDPSVFAAPVTLDHWVKTINGLMEDTFLSGPLHGPWVPRDGLALPPRLDRILSGRVRDGIREIRLGGMSPKVELDDKIHDLACSNAQFLERVMNIRPEDYGLEARKPLIRFPSPLYTGRARRPLSPKTLNL